MFRRALVLCAAATIAALSMTGNPALAGGPPPNQPPVAVDNGYIWTGPGPLSFPGPGILANDDDPDEPPGALTAVLESGPAKGALVLSANGGVSYTPITLLPGETDTFWYRAKDSDGALSNLAKVTMKLLAPQPPVAKNDAYAVSQNVSLVVGAPGVLSNDTDPNFDVLTASVVSAATHGTLVFHPTGGFTYHPAPGWSGTDQFTYKATDEDGMTDTATVKITVNAKSPPKDASGGHPTVTPTVTPKDTRSTGGAGDGGGDARLPTTGPPVPMPLLLAGAGALLIVAGLGMFLLLQRGGRATA